MSNGEDFFDDARVTLNADDEQRIKNALRDLARDPHAPRELTVRVSIHIHNEYPKVVDGRVFQNQYEEDAANAPKLVEPEPEPDALAVAEALRRAQEQQAADTAFVTRKEAEARQNAAKAQETASQDAAETDNQQ